MIPSQQLILIMYEHPVVNFCKQKIVVNNLIASLSFLLPREFECKLNYFPVTNAPMKIMRINRKFKFKTSSNVFPSFTVRDRVKRTWACWEITSLSDCIPWIPTFKYLVPKKPTQTQFSVQSLQ